MNQPAKCFYCEAPADLLCDGGLVTIDDQGRRYFASERAGGYATCDRPLCRKHATNAGSMIVCSRGRRGHSGSCCERVTIDYCAECDAGAKTAGGPWRGSRLLQAGDLPPVQGSLFD